LREQALCNGYWRVKQATLASNAKAQNFTARWLGRRTCLPCSLWYFNTFTGKESSIGVATEYRLVVRGSIPSKNTRYFSSPQR
jgi:hypothetical protein